MGVGDDQHGSCLTTCLLSLRCKASEKKEERPELENTRSRVGKYNCNNNKNTAGKLRNCR